MAPKPTSRPAIQLRPYQVDAVDAVYRHLRERDDNPVVVIPTGGGKTPVMATICRDVVSQWNGRVLVLAHVRELLEQTVDKLHIMAPDLWRQIGVYSAGLKSRDTDHPIIVAGIQSVYKRAAELDAFSLILVDEAHLIPPEGDGMFRQFLADAKVVNPNVRTIGLTATPFRMTTGSICAPENFLNAVCYEIGVKELIVQGHLCRLRSKAGRAKADTSGLHIRGGEFIADEVERLMDDQDLVRSACAELVEQTADRHSVLVFASGIQHGLHIQQALQDGHGQECGFICGDTPDAKREELIELFRSGDLKFLCNVNVLTTGFDATNVDCVALLRPTNSPGLFYQCCGRGFRTDPGKADCLVLDFGGNVMRHGPVDQVKPRDASGRGGEAPAKECPECHAVIAAGYGRCPDCGFMFPERERSNHDAEATTAGVLSGEVTTTEYSVLGISYSVHIKRDAPADSPRTMRVEYQIGLNRWQSEWICFEHTGYARNKAEGWWRQRSNEPVPATAEDAVDVCEAGGICETHAITVRTVAGEKYDRIAKHELGPKPPLLSGADERIPVPEYEWAGDEVPF